MIWETPFKFEANVDKCSYAYVMEQLLKYANETPDKKVLISAENTSHHLSYSELVDQIKAVEVFLDQIGFQKGDIATVYMPNNIEIVPFYIAVLGRGGIYTGISPLYTKYEVDYHLADNGSRVIFTTTSLLANVKTFMEKHNSILTIVVLDCEPQINPSWTDVIQTKGEPVKQTNNIHDIAVLPYSSGTTGLAKGVMLSHYNLMSVVLNMITHAEDQVPHPENTNSVWECVQVLSFPMFHISGKFLILAHLMTGATTIVLNTFDLSVYLEAITNFKVWNLILSPAVLLQLIKDPLLEKYNLSSLGYVTCGGAPLGADLAREFLNKFPNITLTQLYGMTEAMSPFLPRCNKKNNYCTVGCVSPGFDAKIIDVNNGRELGSNEKGELLFRGPSVMKGYLNKPEATKETIDSDGWLHTGDTCYINNEGELFLLDRKKEIIKVNGTFSISPAEIENVLAADPRIKDVGVVGVKNSDGGETPCAFVVKNDPQLKQIDVEMIIKGRLAEWKWTNGRVFFVDLIPKLPSGKILRRLLREWVL